VLEGLQAQHSILIGNTGQGKSWILNMLLLLTACDGEYGSPNWQLLRDELTDGLEAISDSQASQDGARVVLYSPCGHICCGFACSVCPHPIMDTFDIICRVQVKNLAVKRLNDKEESELNAGSECVRDRHAITAGLSGWCEGTEIPGNEGFLLPSCANAGRSTTPSITTLHWGLTWHFSYSVKPMAEICTLAYEFVKLLRKVCESKP